MRTFLFRLIAVCLGLAVAFGLAEVGVRLLRPQQTSPVQFACNPDLGDIPVPNQQGRHFVPGNYDFIYRNNSMGFRGSREFGPKPPGVVRLLLLGDSMTYGLGVNDDQTFACHLERNLREGQIPAEVVNSGCPGKGTDYELKLFQTRGVKLHPDVTVLCFFYNDFDDNARGEYYALKADGGLQAKPLDHSRGGLKTFLCRFPGYSWLISWSQAANLVKHAAVDYLVKRHHEGSGAAAGLVVSYADHGQGFATEPNKQVTAVYVEHLREAVRRAGSELVVFYIPFAQEVETYRRRQEFSPEEQAIKEIIEAGGGALQSLTPWLAATPEPIRELYFAEGHWTPRAHLLSGQYMARYLSSLPKFKEGGGKSEN
jgi:hypothetical protein